MVRAWCLQLGLGLGLWPGNGIISAFFFSFALATHFDIKFYLHNESHCEIGVAPGPKFSPDQNFCDRSSKDKHAPATLYWQPTNTLIFYLLLDSSNAVNTSSLAPPPEGRGLGTRLSIAPDALQLKRTHQFKTPLDSFLLHEILIGTTWPSLYYCDEILHMAQTSVLYWKVFFFYCRVKWWRKKT